MAGRRERPSHPGWTHMAQPTRYARAYSFTGYQTADPSDPLPAQRVDVEFDAVALTTDETRFNLALVQRDDGKLRNASVHHDALERSKHLLLASGRERRRARGGTCG